FSLLDDLAGRLDEFFRECHALLLRGARIHEEFDVVAGFRGDVAGLLTLQNANHHTAGLHTQVAIIYAHGRDRAPHHAIGVGGNQGHLGVDTDLDQRLISRHHVVVGIGVDNVHLTYQTARGRTHVDRARRG